MWQQPDGDPIVIPFSQSKLMLWLLASVGGVVLALAFVVWPERFAHGRHSEEFVILVGLAWGGICVLAGICMLRQLLGPRPALVIDSSGIDEAASAFGVGKLLWSEIDDIVLYRVHGVTLVGIELKDPNVVLRRANPIKSLFLRGNRVLGYPLISVPATSLYITAESLHTLLKEQWERHLA